MIFHGIRTSIAKKPYSFVVLQGGGGDPDSLSPSGSAHEDRIISTPDTQQTKRQVRISRICHTHRSQTNQWHREEGILEQTNKDTHDIKYMFGLASLS